MASAAIQQVTDSSFDATVKSATPTLVDFWAEWCMPCRRIAPTVEALAAEFSGRLTVAKMNVDENPEVPTRLSIRSIPTLMLFKDGSLVDTVIGAVDKDTLRRMIEKHVS
ncbi:MAG TPA: thioredoxin [Vicinamibacterales bacterium]|nr:thioredoxin [Vicinamibacterales bacterium]